MQKDTQTTTRKFSEVTPLHASNFDAEIKENGDLVLTGPCSHGKLTLTFDDASVRLLTRYLSNNLSFEEVLSPLEQK